MDIIIDSAGMACCVYGEEIDLQLLGSLHICRASNVEPDNDGRWWADLSPVGGPKIGPHQHRSEAIRTELQWLREWICH